MAGFETLIHIGGDDGPRPGAASAGLDPAAARIVEDDLLYEAPAAWAGAYPPSFAHAGGVILATAAGVHLGPPGPGGRLTHAVVTRDPAAYGDLRPAQLLGAPFWVTRPPATPRCDAVPGNPPPGRLDTESVRDFVKASPNGQALLATLLTVLTEPAGRRVLFIAEQAEPVVTWIAAATLLLPRRAALDVSFKVFTAGPGHCPQRMVAVHPDAGPLPATVDQPAGLVVVDLRTGKRSESATTPAARDWVRLFCGTGRFDVTGAVDLAAGSGLPHDDAIALARAVMLGQAPPPGNADALAGWLHDGPPAIVTRYGPRLARLFVDGLGGRGRSTLRLLDRAMRLGDLGEGADQVRLAWLGAELGAARTAAPPELDGVPPVVAKQWGDAENRLAVESVLGALRTAAGAEFAAVLLVAGRFRVPLSYAEIGPAADAFVRYWAAHPDSFFEPQDWPCPAGVDERLREHLGEQITTRACDPRRTGGEWSPRLTPRDPADPLDAAMLGATMAEGTGKQRLATLTGQIGRAARAADPPRQFGALSRCLWRWTRATPGELRLFADALPDGAEFEPGVLETYLTDQLRPGPLAAGDLDLVAEQVARGRLRPTALTADLLRSHAAVRDVVAGLPRARRNDKALAQALHHAHPEVVLAHARPLLAALLRTTAPRTVALVFDTVPAAVQRDYVTAVARELAGNAAAAPVGGDAAVALVAGALTVADGHRTQRTANELTNAIVVWLKGRRPGYAEVWRSAGAALGHFGTRGAYALWKDLGGGRRR